MVTPPVRTVALVGAGVIGRSWAALMLARGLQVRVMDPRPEVGDAVTAFVDDAWPALSSLGLAPNGPPAPVEFTTDLSEACSEADFVQESGPERLDVKLELYRQIEAVTDPTTVIASSTSSLRATDLQRGARQPERFLVGHPMNPPHLIPLVEIVGGEQTSTDSVRRASEFYELLGREVVVARREAVGHIANRLTSALYREAVSLVAEGIASVEDVDRAIAHGPGLRWALIGPHQIYHLAGGAGGYRHYLEHLGPSQEARWKSLGHPRLTEEVVDTLVSGLDEAVGGRCVAELVDRRDRALLEILGIKKKMGY